MEIAYNDPTNFGGNQNPQALFNGNISQVQWKTASANTSGNPVSERYSLGYDPLNRIISATDNTGNYNVSNIGYDKNGNIQSLTRNGYQNSSTFTDMDILDYDYDDGNKLLKVADTGNRDYGFKEPVTTGDDYRYDPNGNLVMDRNKGIGTATVDGIEYNHLNLPIRVTVANSQHNGTIDYVYDANGTKLKKIVSDGTVTEYAGNYIYEGNATSTTLQFFSQPEGYITPNGTGGYSYVYQYRDNLDNIRLSYTDDPSNPGTPTIIEENNFYPFGMKHRGYNMGGDTALGNDVAQRWKFGGKEFDESLGLASYDFGARYYMPDIGRWGVIDPKADDILQVDITPYNYSWNNPTNINDPDGECPWCWGAVIGFAVEYGSQVASNLIAGQDLGDALTNVDGGKLLLATATGAATGGLSSIKVVGAAAKVYKGVAVSSTAAGGNILKQGLVDKNKTVDVKEMATDALLENVELPKLEIPTVKKETIKTAEKQLDRAERVAGDNPRPSRAEAVKESKQKVENLKNKKETIDKANEVGNAAKDAATKETAKNAMESKEEKAFKDLQFKWKQ